MNARCSRFVASAVLTALLAVPGAPPAHAAPASGASPAPSPTIGPPIPSLSGASPQGAIGKLERDRTTPPAKLGNYLASTDPAVAARAAIAIGRLRNAAGVPLLAAAIRDKNRPEKVRAAAAFGLGLIGSADGIAALEDATHDAPAVAGAAADSLGRIGGNRAAYDLIAMAAAGDPFVRGKAAIGLGEAASPTKPSLSVAYRQAAARALSAEFTVERDPEVRWRIAWALARSFYADATNTLRFMLTDQQELVRVMALKGIGKLADPSLAVPVRLLAHDPSWRVRVEVRDALIAMGDHSTIVDVTPPAVPADDSVPPAPLPNGAPYGDHPQVAFVTNRGSFVVEMFPDEAPYNVDSFLHLVDRGVYDDNAFFRVIWDFVAQGGGYHNDPNANPPYTVPAEVNPVEQLTGTLSLGLDYDEKTKMPKLDSGGTQFYVTESPLLHLDEAFSTMGRVVKGMAVVDVLAEHSETDPLKSADYAIKVYRCQPVTPQTASAEHNLRTVEVNYQAP